LASSKRRVSLHHLYAIATEKPDYMRTDKKAQISIGLIYNEPL